MNSLGDESCGNNKVGPRELKGSDIHAGNWKYAIHPMGKCELKIKNPNSYLYLKSLKCLAWCLFVTM